jgi:hypothetical protein
MTTATITKPVNEMTAAEVKTLLAHLQEKEAAERENKKIAYEQLRNETVENLCLEASAISGTIKDFATKVFADLGAQYDLLKEYSSRHEKGKGNFTITNADNTMRVRFRANKSGYFDERSVQGEKHIKEFITNKFSGDPDTKEVISSLIERSKGHLDINLVQKLYKFDERFNYDENWREGIRLLKESWTEGKTRFYAQFEVLMNDSWTAIIMDFAALCNQN